ncbi:MAG: hypothetical protein IJJ33_17340 [Victivallales bacterium]|nr:hypothetical protein [Victivallales bacterium]
MSDILSGALTGEFDFRTGKISGLPTSTIQDGALTAAFSGVLLNGDELRTYLQADTHTSVAELCARLYAQHGLPGLAKLNGPFILALADTRGDAPQLLLARDHHGQKGLYYASDGQRVRFSAELPNLQDCAQGIDTGALADYLGLGYVPAPVTIWKGIAKVPSSCAVQFRRGTPQKTTPYWTPAYLPKQKLSYEEAVAETRRLVEQAVRRCLAQIPDAGALLSGGIDSNVVLGLSHARNAFTIGFEQTDYDERALAGLSARKHNAQHFTLLGTAEDADLLTELQKASGEPFADSSLVATALAMRLAAEHGTAALAGDGGDELFGGYRRYQLMAIRDRFGEALTKSFAALANLLTHCLPAATDQRSRMANLQRLANALTLTPVPCYASFQGIFPAQMLQELAPGLAPQSTYLEKWQKAYDELTDLEVFERVNYLDLRHYLPDDGCRKATLAETGTGLTVLAPLLDMDVTRFALSLPSKYRITMRERKRMLRAIGQDLLPPELLTQKKRGFGVPVAAWLRGPLAPQMRALYQEQASWDTDGWFEPTALKQLVESHIAGQADHSSRLWCLHCLRLWKQG